jgi:hypothetical protein
LNEHIDDNLDMVSAWRIAIGSGATNGAATRFDRRLANFVRARGTPDTKKPGAWPGFDNR